MRKYNNYQTLRNMVFAMLRKNQCRSHITTNQLTAVIYTMIMISRRDFTSDKARSQLIGDILRLACHQQPITKYRYQLRAGYNQFKHLIGDNDVQQLQHDLVRYAKLISENPSYRWWWHIENYKVVNHLKRSNDQAALKMLGYSYLVNSEHKNTIRQLLVTYAKKQAISLNALTNIVCLILARTPDTVAEFKVYMKEIVKLSQHLSAKYAIAKNIKLEAAHYLSHSKQLTHWRQHHTDDELKQMLLGAGTLIITSPKYAEWQRVERIWRSSVAIDLTAAAK